MNEVHLFLNRSGSQFDGWCRSKDNPADNPKDNSRVFFKDSEIDLESLAISPEAKEMLQKVKAIQNRVEMLNFVQNLQNPILYQRFILSTYHMIVTMAFISFI